MPGKPDAPVVLVVDDEPLLRMDAVDILEDKGFETVEAQSAKDWLSWPSARTCDFSSLT